MTGLFRTAALNKIAHPDQLDTTLQVVRPLHTLGVAVAALIVVGGFVWSILSTAPIKVHGQGILLSTEGVSLATAPKDGRVEDITIEPGDAVQAGQVIVVLSRPLALDEITAKEAELRDARSVLGATQAAYALNRSNQNDLLLTKQKALTERLAKLSTQHALLTDRRRNEHELLTKGYTTASKVNETDTLIADVENRIATAQNDRTELEVARRVDETQKEKEIQELTVRVRALELQWENLRREYERNRYVRSPVTGTAVEFSVNEGALVSMGQPIVRLLAADAGVHGRLEAIIFVSNTDGKKIKPGMSANIIPSTTRPEKDGFIRGTVLEIAKIPSSREGIMRRLQNAALVDTLLKSGAPFEVELALETNTDSPSGYLWSSGVGPDISIDIGTMARADVVVGNRRVISLALPVFDHVFRWLEAY